MGTNGDLIGTVVDGAYRIDTLLGTGGMGSVYEATQLQLDRKVAIKILRSEFVADKVAQSRFLREARAAARIEHPNAIRVYDYGTLPDDGAYLVMEYVDGLSLRDLLSEQGRLSTREAAALAAQTAWALGAAHKHGIVHRDIKPENIMIREAHDGRPLVKVVDFGIAKVLTSDDATQLTQPAELIGTPRYMAPEIFGDEAIDGRVDIYALGIVLYEMLTGQTPFEGTYGEVIGKHLFTEPASFESLGLQIPETIEGIVRRALAKSPEERFETAEQLARELEEMRVDLATTGEMPVYVTGADRVDELTTRLERKGPAITLQATLAETANVAKSLLSRTFSSTARRAAAAAATLVAVAVLVGAPVPEPQRSAEAAPQPPAILAIPIDREEATPSEPASERAPISAAPATTQPDVASERRSEPRVRESSRRTVRKARANPMKSVGRALRVDRHLRRLF